LEVYYPQAGVCLISDNQGKKRNEVTELRISEKNLTGSCDLTGFVNLKELICYQNKLTQIVLPQSNKLRELSCYDNQLTSFDYSVLNPQTLAFLEL
jgi:Leucine-rich repeat (LRR) protein